VTSPNSFAEILLDPDKDGFTSSFENSYSALDPTVFNSLADVAAPSTQPDVNTEFSTHMSGWHYTEDLGWLYTTHDLYPFIYRKTEFADKWIYHLPGSHSPRYFYDYSVGTWFELD
jgi:hypothetical protein